MSFNKKPKLKILSMCKSVAAVVLSLSLICSGTLGYMNVDENGLHIGGAKHAHAASVTNTAYQTQVATANHNAEGWPCGTCGTTKSIYVSNMTVYCNACSNVIYDSITGANTADNYANWNNSTYVTVPIPLFTGTKEYLTFCNIKKMWRCAATTAVAGSLDDYDEKSADIYNSTGEHYSQTDYLRDTASTCGCHYLMVTTRQQYQGYVYRICKGHSGVITYFKTNRFNNPYEGTGGTSTSSSNVYDNADITYSAAIADLTSKSPITAVSYSTVDEITSGITGGKVTFLPTSAPDYMKPTQTVVDDMYTYWSYYKYLNDNPSIIGVWTETDIPANYTEADCSCFKGSTAAIAYDNLFATGYQYLTSTITYDANGGSGTMESIEVNTGDSFTPDNEFVKDGHTFLGWSTTSNGNVEYEDGFTITPTGNMTLYAVWEATPYDITCIDMDSTHNIELGRTTVQKSYGTSVMGSDFGADKTLGTYYSGYSFTVGTSATVTTDAGSNIVYRYFEPTTCSVTLVDMVLNEDTVLGTDTSGTKLAGDVARGADYGTASPYQGYTFNSDTSATVSGDGTTVYRYFTRNNYTVAYVDVVAGENGKELGRTNVDKGFDISVSGAELGTDATIGAYYPGYYYNGNSSTSVVTIDGATVYRYFEPASYDVTYISVVNDVAGRELGREMKAGAGLFDSIVSGDAIGTDTTEGAYFPGYSYYASTNATVTTEGAVVYRIFKPMQYSLSLELNGGTLDDPMDSYEFGAYVELPNVYRIGYSFKGWYDNAECVGEPVTAIATGETGAKTYYALWSNDNYTIKMDYAGTGNAVTVSRDGAVVEDGSVHYGDTVTVNFGIDAGRKFNGYSITETVTDAVASGNGITFTMPNSDVNIVTYWLECSELLAGTNAAFDAVYKVEPYWNGTAFNVDAEPAITITPDMVSVFARVYNTQTQTWEEISIDSATVSFVGSNVLSDINNTIFTVQTDVFGDGYNQQGSFSLTGASGALDNAMNNSNSGNYVELKGYIDNMENDIALYEKLVSDLQTKLNISNELKEEYSAKVAELASELVKAQADYEKAQSDNAERIAELQSQLAQNEEQYASRISELMAQIEIIDAALQQEGADIENLTGQRDELNRQLAEVIAERDSATSALQTELNSLTTEVQTYRDKMTALQGELETTRTTYEGQIASLETELDEIRTETDALLAKIQTMEDAIKEILGRDDINLNDGSLDDLKGVLDDLKDKVDDLTGKNNQLEDAIESKEDVIDDLDKIIDDLRDSIKDKTEEIEELEAQNKSDSKELEKLKEEVATNKGIIKTLESQKSSLEQEITVLRTQVDSYKEQVVSLQAQLEEKNATILSLQSEIASLKSNGGSQQVNVTGVSTVTVEKEKEIAMDELTVTPLSLITIANDEKEPLEPLVYTGEQELLSDYPEIVEDTVMSDSTLAEGDDSMTIPVQVWFGLAGAVLVAGFGIFYFLNRRYHWKVLPF